MDIYLHTLDHGPNPEVHRIIIVIFSHYVIICKKRTGDHVEHDYA